MMSRKLVNEIYALTKSQGLKIDFSFCDQLRRASLSLMNNIAEGFSRNSDKEFIRYLVIASASCSEVKSMMYILEDQAYTKKGQSISYFDLCNTIQAKVHALIRYLKIRLIPKQYEKNNTQARLHFGTSTLQRVRTLTPI